MSEKLPGGEIYLYGLFNGDKQIGFQCFANYTPREKGKPMIFHFNRTVIHPDYQGLGLGIKLINETCHLFRIIRPASRIMGKFSSMPIYRAMIRSPEWKFMGQKRLMGAMRHGKDARASGFREKGIKTYHFEWIGRKDEKN